MDIIYLHSATPSKSEEKLISGLEKVSLRNARKWKGEIEPCDVVYTDNPAISAKYAGAGVKVEPITKPVSKAKTRKAKANG